MNDCDFDRLVRHHYNAIVTYARAISRNRWVAEEAVQETLLRAWKYLDSFDEGGSFEGWLIRICRNCVTDIAAQQRPTEVLRDPATRVAHLNSTVEIDELISTLPVEHREVVVLCGTLGYDYETAALLLDIPLGTVRSRVFRARRELARKLEESDHIETRAQRLR